MSDEKREGVAPAASAPDVAAPSCPAQPEAAPSPKACDSAPPRHQVHHSYIWLGSLRAAFVGFCAVIFSALSSIPGLIVAGPVSLAGVPVLIVVVLALLAVFAAIFAITLLVHRVAYKHLWYELGEEEFSLYSGIFNKKRTHVPYRRVQSVDQRASLLQRVFGVCTVTIDTAGGSSNKATLIPYVTKAQAEELRRELFARKRYQEAVRDGVDPRQAAAALAAMRAAFSSASGSAGASLGAQATPASGAGIPVAGGSASADASAAAFSAIPAPGASTGAAAPGSAPTPANAPTFVAGAAASAFGASGAPSASGGVSASGNILDFPAEAWDDVRGIFAGSAVDTGSVSYEYGLTNKELVLTGISGNTAFALVVLGILGAIAQFVGDIAPIAADVVPPSVGNAVVAGAQVFGGSLIAAGVAVVVGIALATWLLSAAAACVSYGGFRARRRANRVEVEYGLLQHTFQGIDVDRVQSVTVKQSFIRRLMGYCEISVGKIDAADSSGDQQSSGLGTQGVIVHPFVKIERVPEILAGLLPEFAGVPTTSTPVARAALRRSLIRRCIVQGTGFWLAVGSTLVCAMLAWLLDPSNAVEAVLVAYLPVAAAVAYALSATLLVLDAIGAVLWFRGSSFAFNKRFMQISNAGFARETVSFPRGKIQFGTVSTNPFQRRAHTATICVRTAAGVGGTTVRLVDACEEDANVWLNWLKPHGLQARNVLE